MDDEVTISACVTTLPQCWICFEAEPVGARFFQLQRMRRDIASLDTLLARQVNCGAGGAADNDGDDNDDSDGGDDAELPLEDNGEYVRSLDPKQWLKQDHYRVLGLSTLRHSATQHQIRSAYRAMVLRHHPDKRPTTTTAAAAATTSAAVVPRGAAAAAASSGAVGEDDYFTCITRAYETLSDRSRRAAYDSVDPVFDDSVPTERVPAHQFYATFAPVFERNAHWSTRRYMPVLGDAHATREQVEHFYSEWFGMESWREFSYQDDQETAPERGENRDERRYLERQIRAVRKERKRAESTRIRQLVQLAHDCDPRVQHFRQQDRQRKLEVKQRRADERRRRHEAEQAVLQRTEQERQQREAAEAQRQREAAALARRQRDASRQRLAAGRQRVRRLCERHDYYAADQTERLEHMVHLERLCSMLDAQRLEQLAARLEEPPTAGSESPSELRQLFRQQAQQLIADASSGEAVRATGDRSDSTPTTAAAGGGAVEWSHDELQALIRAVRLFPAGTVRRWEVVANFVGQHSGNGCQQRSAKQVLDRAKQLQRSDEQLRLAAQEHALRTNNTSDSGHQLHQQQQQQTINGDISQRTETPLEQQGSNQSAWSGEEQRLLEQALKTYDAKTPQRWQRVAECLPNRTRRDCLLRYKELVEIVKAKRAAQAAVTTAAK